MINQPLFAKLFTLEMPFQHYNLEFMYEIIPRQKWAERKAVKDDLIKLKLPVEVGVIGHHTGRREHQSSTKGV